LSERLCEWAIRKSDDFDRAQYAPIATALHTHHVESLPARLLEERTEQREYNHGVDLVSAAPT